MTISVKFVKPEINLQLTVEQFTLLGVILTLIGGYPENSPRKYAKELYSKFYDSIPEMIDGFNSAKLVSDKNRCIDFKDNTLESFGALVEIASAELIRNKV